MKSTTVILTGLLLGVCIMGHAEPLKVVFVSGSFEYDSDTSLSGFKSYLEANYDAKVTFVSANGSWTDLPGLAALEDCDTALFFTRRLKIEGEQLQRVKDYCLRGNPVVGVRTASHGFQNWLEMDQEVLGGNYHNHYGRGPTFKCEVPHSQKDHPVLEGVDRIASRDSLYKNKPISEDATVLMTGHSPEAVEPVTWVREYKGARVFYTSLGGRGDFDNSSFKRLLANALSWSAGRKAEPKPQPEPKRREIPEGTLNLNLHSRVEAQPGSGEWKEVVTEKQLPVSETAIIICDMWDNHWCRGATERCAALAEKMNPVLHAARAAGVQIIHAPSDTLGFYNDWPQRRRMQLAPDVATPEPLDITDPPLPIDDSDGGCDTEGDESYMAWTRQHPVLDIGEFDGISDDGAEVWNFFQQEGIKHVIIMGVHTNMCVLGRSFAIRQMTRWGIDCILVRDLTDAMYDPNDPPHVSHDEGTQLVVQHIEKYWCPSMTSEDLLKGLP